MTKEHPIPSTGYTLLHTLRATDARENSRGKGWLDESIFRIVLIARYKLVASCVIHMNTLCFCKMFGSTCIVVPEQVLYTEYHSPHIYI